ncbi:MAG: hypothetical protein SangKO_088270 [Sandaracinaceae bacterium]
MSSEPERPTHGDDDVPSSRPSLSPPAPRPEDERAEASDLRPRWWQVATLVLAVAVAIGFMTGTRGDQHPYRRAAEPRETSVDLAVAPSYAGIRGAPLGPNRERHAAALAAMAADHPGLMDAVPPRSDEAVEAELTRRARLRAYDGAPPRIPHEIAPRGPLDCVACHLEGIRIGARVAPPMSHALMTQCTQCHVPDEGQMPGPRAAAGPPSENRFTGRPAPTRGPRMVEGAPPQIPHSTQLRERCDSCHGVWGSGIRTTHPWRRSCPQCHAPSADADQRPRGGIGGAVGPPVAPMPGGS